MKQQFIRAIQDRRAAVLAALDGVDEARLTTVPVCGTWTARDVLAHLVAVDAAVLGALRLARAGQNVTWAWDGCDGDAWNAAQVAARRDRSVPQLLAELDESHRNVVAELEPWPADGGPFGPETWDEAKSPIGWLPSHDQEHAEAIQMLSKG